MSYGRPVSRRRLRLLSLGTTFAVAFAIEHTDLVANDVAARVRRELLAVPALRAARLGAQRRDLGEEARLAARELRRIADELDRTGAPFSTAPALTGPRLRIRRGLAAERVGDSDVALRGPTASRMITLDPALARVLAWATGEPEFEVSDAIREHSEIDPELVRGCVRQLVRSGLVEVLA